MMTDGKLSKLEGRATDLGRKPKTVPEEVVSWWSEHFTDGSLDRSHIPLGVRHWADQAIYWIEYGKTPAEMKDWELMALLIAQRTEGDLVLI